MNPLTVVLIVALCGVAGGFALGASALFQDRRDRWERKRDLYDAALHDELDDLEPAYGLVALDEQVLPDIVDEPSKKLLRRWRWGWRINFALACPVCGGWHWCWATLAFWSVAAWVTDGTAPVSWASVLPVFGAAAAVHTLVTSAVINFGWWDDE